MIYSDFSLDAQYANTSDDSRMSSDMKEFREELVRHLETGFMRAFPGSKVTNFVEKLLVEPKMLLVTVIAESIRPDIERQIDLLANALLTVFEYSNKVDLLLKWAIHQELSSKSWILIYFLSIRLLTFVNQRDTTNCLEKVLFHRRSSGAIFTSREENT